MQRAVPDATGTGFEFLIPTLALSAPDNRHVLAAALHAKADLLPFNLRDFPANAARGVRIWHPDRALSSLASRVPEVFVEILDARSTGLRRPPMGAANLVTGLDALGLKVTATRLGTLL